MPPSRVRYTYRPRDGRAIVHEVRLNGQHRVLASDGRWRRTHTRVSPNRNLHRPGHIGGVMRAAIEAAKSFEQMQRRMAREQRVLDAEAVRQEHEV